MTEQDPLLVTAKEACRLLGCSDTHLRRLTAAGKIELKYLGNRRRYVMESLRTFVENLPQESDGAP